MAQFRKSQKTLILVAFVEIQLHLTKILSIVSLKEKEAIKGAAEVNENKDVNLKNVLIKEVSDNFLSKVILLSVHS